MTKALLVERGERGDAARVAEVLDNPRRLAAALSPVAWKILSAIAREPDYPGGIARRLGLHEQKVYYHIRRLLAAGLVKPTGEGRRGGATVKFLSPVAEAFAVALPGSPRGSVVPPPRLDRAFVEFFSDFCRQGSLEAPLVVGSPAPHGPFLTAARDGHHAVELGMFLGQMARPPPKGAVLLDTEVKAGGREAGDMVLIGGPVANIISLELNPHLPIRFDWREGWRLVSAASEKVCAGDLVGLIAKVANPWGQGHNVVLVSGLHQGGTAACVLAITRRPDKVLKGYRPGQPFFRVLEGLDRDGDGRVDDVVILE